jgi:hypothetical protein
VLVIAKIGLVVPVKEKLREQIIDFHECQLIMSTDATGDKGSMRMTSFGRKARSKDGVPFDHCYLPFPSHQKPASALQSVR